MEENILTAEKAREIALSWENNEVAKSRTKILSEVEATAKQGGRGCWLYICKGSPEAFYDSLEAQMKTLGYHVNRNGNTWGGGSWYFKW